MITLQDDYPFMAQLRDAQSHKVRKSVTGEANMSNGEVIQVSRVANYSPVLFTRVAQYRELLNQLSLEGSKLFMHIALHLDYEEIKIHIRRNEVGMSKRVFSRAVLELIGFEVITPVMHKRELYWVNLAVICVGTVPKLKKD